MHTEPIGSRKPNRIGLYDVSGNVWDWVEDCWHENYNTAPKDGSAWLDAAVDKLDWRVIRGGPWNSIPVGLRLSNRTSAYFLHSNDTIGFRLARDLP
jgi:formylglycine-generating enzyme required for sulfatase activity